MARISALRCRFLAAMVLTVRPSSAQRQGKTRDDKERKVAEPVQPPASTCTNPSVCFGSDTECCPSYSCLENECEFTSRVCGNPRMCFSNYDCCNDYICFQNECEHTLLLPYLTPDSSSELIEAQASAPSTVTYRPGDLTVRQNGLLLSAGLTSKILARTGQPVVFEDGSSSDVPFHDQPDAGAVFRDRSAENGDGWALVSNAEVEDGGGGVGSMIFNSAGEPIRYEMVLTNTSRNCGGGKTYWNTWVSCEENGDDGQIWEVDPFGRTRSNMTAMGETGGNYESMAYDKRDPAMPRFFVTRDSPKGEIRRFTPASHTLVDGNSHSILITPGTIEYLILSPVSSNSGTFSWTSRLKKGRRSAKAHFQSCEGIDFRDGLLYFVSKRQKELFVLDLDVGTYTKSSTETGAFNGEPDQIKHLLGRDGNPIDEILYFTEDGGDLAGIHGRDGEGNFLTVVEAADYTDETTGLAFSPDQMHMYFAVQDEGILFDVTREDGLPFGGKTLNIKYHRMQM